MTVMQIKPGVSAFSQAQNWRGRTDSGAGYYRDVITDVTVTRKGSLRRAAPAILLAVALVLFLSILTSDLCSINAASAQTQALSSSIASLENSNNLLRNELSIALNHPVLRNQTDLAEPEITTLIRLTAGPAQ